ncbi:hypothetical protein TrLO_g13468 [Triparma laevis f. longispina]|uniref:Uncharacterized protein n=1 Tax=Triparma laevis f. longispina TaxID=1714387 RepID=A0A9W7E393_9STRA|nr:hypothetical protein TrLO_g13468 [Triparma laevis f. longispina]
MDILQCQNPMHCKGGVDTDDLCAEGYTGPLCAACDTNFAAVGFGQSLTCNVCDMNSEATVAIIVAIILLVFAAILACYLKKGLGEDAQSLLRQRSRSASEAISSTAQNFEKYQPIIKIIFTYYQVVGSLGFVYILNFPRDFYAVTSVFGGIVSLDFISFIPLGCIAPADFYSELLAYTLVPLFLSAALIAYYKKLSTSADLEAKISKSRYSKSS